VIIPDYSTNGRTINA